MKRIPASIIFILSGFIFALATYWPETQQSALGGLLFALLLAYGAKKSKAAPRDFYLSGLVFHVLAFYWLPNTIIKFGDFHPLAAYAFFSLFCAVSALQFFFCGWIYYRLRRTALEHLLLALPFSWLAAELLFPRLFPWAFGHVFVSWTWLSGLAEYCGVYPISALVIWWGVSLSYWLGLFFGRQAQPRRAQTVIACSTAAVLLLGSYRSFNVEQEMAQAETVKAGLIQGDLAIGNKDERGYLEVNLLRYRQLSEEAKEKGAEFLIWPESVIVNWTSETEDNLRGSKNEPFPGAGVPIVYGTPSFRLLDGQYVTLPDGRQRQKFWAFNSAFAIAPDGKVVGRYQKRVLMPFGEYLPFEAEFPWLRDISPQSGNFTAGSQKTPILIEIKKQKPGSASRQIWAGILICYEDLVPWLSREESMAGANVLLNLTNDAWYDNTAAPYQHHLLAQWRAIENRRFLLRTTHTGYTAVVDALGRTRQGLPLFKPAYIVADIPLLSGVTFYARTGDLLAWACVVVSSILALFAYLVGELEKEAG